MTGNRVCIDVGGFAGIIGEVVRRERRQVLIQPDALPPSWPPERTPLWYGPDEYHVLDVPAEGPLQERLDREKKP